LYPPSSLLRFFFLFSFSGSTANNKTFAFFFEWFFPKHWNRLLRMLDACWDLPQFVIPFFRFLSELVLNKSQRINFDVSSPNGLLLFKEVSKCIEIFGVLELLICRKFQLCSFYLLNSGLRTLSSMGAAVQDPYKQRFKGISLAMQVLSRALGGGFCPFGVFALYQDASLSSSIDTIVKVFVFALWFKLFCFL
jgi:exportin-7